MARPTDFSTEIADTICDKIADGESLRSICAAEDMPAKSTVFRWLSLHKEFSDQYARAREAQADSLFDEILDIADDGVQDVRETEDGREIVNHDHIQRSKLRVDARKWMAGKLQPKKYGEKVTQDHTVANPDGTPIETGSRDLAKAIGAILSKGLRDSGGD